MRNKLYTQFFAAWNTANLPMERADFIQANTNGKHTSLKTVSEPQLRFLISILTKPNSNNIDPVQDKMRKKILALYKTKYPSSSWAEAKSWAENQGVMIEGVLIKRSFNQYTKYELTKLIDKAERMVNEENGRISRM